MAFSNVWNYCVPLTILTIACLVRTGKPLRPLIHDVKVALDLVLAFVASLSKSRLLA